MKPKYKVGDSVMITTESLRGREGVITRILDENLQDNPNGSTFIIENGDTVQGYTMNALQFELINHAEDEKNETGYYSEAAHEMLSKKPIYRPGDVIHVKNDMGGIFYVIEESTLVEHNIRGGLYPVYQYTINLLDDGTGHFKPDRGMCEEGDIEFQYHDKQWEEYFTEGRIITDDEAFLEMAGRLPRDKSGRCNLAIAVGADERNIAHFHVFRSEEDLRAWRHGACLYFKENKYYDHSNNTETLTKDELNDVVRILKSKLKDLDITNWKYLVSLWNYNNDRYSIDDDTPMPDYNYRTITRYKEKDIDKNVKELFERVNSNHPNRINPVAIDGGFMGIRLAVCADENTECPHFHFFRNLKPDEEIPKVSISDGGCLAIESPNYLSHGKRTERLNPNEVKGLIRFLKSINKTNTMITNWDYIIDLWNTNNPDQKQLQIGTPLPDYKSIMSTIKEIE